MKGERGQLKAKVAAVQNEGHHYKPKISMYRSSAHHHQPRSCEVLKAREERKKSLGSSRKDWSRALGTKAILERTRVHHWVEMVKLLKRLI